MTVLFTTVLKCVEGDIVLGFLHLCIYAEPEKSFLAVFFTPDHRFNMLPNILRLLSYLSCETLLFVKEFSCLRLFFLKSILVLFQ